MKKFIKKLLKAFAIPCVIGSAKPKAKTLEERILFLENEIREMRGQLYTYYTDDVCVKGERISRIDRLEKHCQ